VGTVTPYRLPAVARTSFLSSALHSRITVTDDPVSKQRRALKTVLTQRDAAEVVSRQLLTAETRVRCQVSPNENFGGQSGPGIGLSASTDVYQRQYYSTGTPYPFICHPLDVISVPNFVVN
jgi:hypothetical protein